MVPAQRELSHMELAQEHCSCRSQSVHDSGVFAGQPSLHERGATKSRDSCRVDQIFDRNRDAMQTAQIRAACDFPFGTVSLFERAVGQNGAVAV